MIFSLIILTFAITTLFGGMLQDPIGPQKVTLIGGLLLGGGLILASQASTIGQIYLFYGVISGTGMGFAYITPLATCNKWFPDKKGIVSGFVVAGMGIGTLVFTPIGRLMVLNRGVLSTWLILGLVFMALISFGALFLKLPPDGATDAKPPGRQQLKSDTRLKDYSQAQMLRTSAFYLIWFMFLIGSGAGLMVIGLAAPIGQELAGLTAGQAAGVVSLLGVFNVSGRILWGAVSDRFGRTKVLFSMFILTSLSLLMLSISTSLFPLVFAFASITLCFGGFLAVFPATTAEFFGTKNLGGNYGLVYIAYGIGGTGGMYMGSILPLTTAFVVAGICCLGGAGLALMTRAPAKPTQS